MNLTGKLGVNLHFDMSCRAPLHHAEIGSSRASHVKHLFTFIMTGFG